MRGEGLVDFILLLAALVLALLAAWAIFALRSPVQTADNSSVQLILVLALCA